MVKSVPTLVPLEPTARQDIPNWWKWSIENRSKDLWCPTKMDMCHTSMNTLPKYLHKMESKSWST